MNRRLIVGSVVTCALAATSNTAARQAQQPTFRARTDVVTVNVSVMKGRDPVTGLRATDFELTDNGVRQTIDAISLEQVPLDLTLVLTAFSAERTDDHARGLVSAEATRQLLRPADRLRIVWANDDVRGGLVGPDYSMATDPSYLELGRVPPPRTASRTRRVRAGSRGSASHSPTVCSTRSRGPSTRTGAISSWHLRMAGTPRARSRWPHCPRWPRTPTRCCMRSSG